MDLLIVVIVGAVAVGCSLGLGVVLNRRGAVVETAAASEQAAQRLAEAEAARRQTIEAARVEAADLRSLVEADAQAQRAELEIEQQRLEQKEETLARKLEDIDQRERKLNQRTSELQNQSRDFDRLRNDQVKELERVSHLPWSE